MANGGKGRKGREGGGGRRMGERRPRWEREGEGDEWKKGEQRPGKERKEEEKRKNRGRWRRKKTGREALGCLSGANHVKWRATYIHPLSISNLTGADGDVSAQWAEETSKVEIVDAPPVAMHVTEAEQRDKLCLDASLFQSLTDCSLPDIFTWARRKKKEQAVTWVAAQALECDLSAHGGGAFGKSGGTFWAHRWDKKRWRRNGWGWIMHITTGGYSVMLQVFTHGNLQSSPNSCWHDSIRED